MIDAAAAADTLVVEALHTRRLVEETGLLALPQLSFGCGDLRTLYALYVIVIIID